MERTDAKVSSNQRAEMDLIIVRQASQIEQLKTSYAEAERRIQEL